MGGTIDHAALQAFVATTFEKLGVPGDDARMAATIMVAADLRGVDSHGVEMLPRKVGYMKLGLIDPTPQIKVVHETTATALLDGGNGLGEVVGKRGMEICIQKAKASGAGFVTVRNSNHYGTAAYFAMMALEHDMIGLSMTNATPLLVPTFGRTAVLGTNPLSVAAPADQERPFVLDMATSVVPSGKMAVYKHQGKSIPAGWAIDNQEQPMHNPAEVAAMLWNRTGGGLLPLGGVGEALSGHKGYGLALMVDIFSGILSGAAYGPFVNARKNGQPLPGNVGHFFGALAVDAFRPLAEFKQTMDELIHILKDSPKAAGHDRIYIHGEKEFELEEARRRNGIPLHPEVVSALKQMAADVGVPFTL
jgi:L-2-hydroxycarboxylate dehydrogenase (NAD+)